MLTKHLLPLAAVAQAAWAQSLTDVLTSQNDTLSTLISLIQGQPELLTALAGLEDITILAPSNDAFTTLLSDPAVASLVESDPSLVPALLTYHVINGTFYAADLTGADGSVFVPTLLTDEAYSTVSGGQRLEVQGSSDGVAIFSGGKAQSNVQKTDLNFTGGTIHIIDTVLTIPPNLTVALTSSSDQLSSLTSALTTASLVQPLLEIPELTVFAPNNAAFEAIADVTANLTVEQLTSVLGYHVIEGAVVYSADITNGTKVKTLQGGEVEVTVNEEGSVFVNKAKVVLADVLVKNGVVHVIDGVLIPEDLAGSPAPSGTPSSSATPSSTSPAASGTSSVTPGMGASMGLGSMTVGVAAVLGGVAVIFNM